MTAETIQLIAALKLMGIGMGVVYLMLGVMVLAIKLLSWLVGHEEVELVSQVAPLCVTSVVTPATIAAIGAALHRYQSDSASSASSHHQEEKR